MIADIIDIIDIIGGDEYDNQRINTDGGSTWILIRY